MYMHFYAGCLSVSVKGQPQIGPGEPPPAGGGGAVQPLDGAEGLAILLTEGGQTHLGWAAAQGGGGSGTLLLVLGMAQQLLDHRCPRPALHRGAPRAVGQLQPVQAASRMGAEPALEFHLSGALNHMGGACQQSLPQCIIFRSGEGGGRSGSRLGLCPAYPRSRPSGRVARA